MMSLIRFRQFTLAWLFSNCLLLLNPALSLAETLYIKTKNTKLLAEESVRSRVIQKLPAEKPVKVMVKHKRFYRVALTNEKQGWVFKFKLTSKAPLTRARKSGFADILAGGLSIPARKSTGGSSIRGLSTASEIYATNKGLSSTAIQAVADMENYTLSQTELDQFQKEGGLEAFKP